MNRGRIKKILLPFIVKHTLLSLICASIIFIVFLMFKLVSTLVKEITLMSDHHHQLTTEQVLCYIKNFFMFVLFGSLQLFGLYGVIKTNRNILVAFISSLLVSFVFTLVDHLLSSGYLLIGIYFLVQALFAYLYILTNLSRSRQLSNIHYIPMPNQESCAQSGSNYKYLQV